MIKLTVDNKVLAALQIAYPKANSAKKALEKYILALEKILDDAVLRKQGGNYFSISLHQLANETPSIGSRNTKDQMRLHTWLDRNNLSLIASSNAQKGVAYKKSLSLIGLTNLVKKTIVDDRYYQQEAFEKLYPDFNKLTDQQILEDYDALEIDLKSLDNYIANPPKRSNKSKKNIDLKRAKNIAAVSSYKNGIYYQKKKAPSFFGRTYYEGVSIQNVGKELRAAMLGHCWEYDIRSSVVSWKLGFAQAYIDEYEPNGTIENVFPYCLQYSIDKKPLIDNIRLEVFKLTKTPLKDQQKIIKDAMTALNFGARLADNNYKDKSGKYQTQSIGKIIKNRLERALFLNCPEIKNFQLEQKKLNKAIMNWVRKEKPEDLEKIDEKTGKKLKGNVLFAYLYQHAETEVMKIFRDIAKQHNLTILANIHDAIILRDKLDTDLKGTIEQAMRTHTNNTYWTLGEKEIG